MTAEITDQPASPAAGARERLARRLRLAAGRLRVPRPHFPRLKGWQLIVLGLLGVLILVWVSVTISFTSLHSAQMYVVEGRAIGIPPPTEELDFGDVPLGVEMERKLTLTNGSPFPTRVTIFAVGGIRDFIEIEDAFFTLGPGDERTILLEGRGLVGAEARKYTGRVVVIQTPWPIP